MEASQIRISDLKFPSAVASRLVVGSKSKVEQDRYIILTVVAYRLVGGSKSKVEQVTL